MMKYLNINSSTRGEIINKINECVRSLNIIETGKSGETLEICAACGNFIRPGKPVATEFHCVLCGAALPLDIEYNSVNRRYVEEK